jgi:hypothetical protein
MNWQYSGSAYQEAVSQNKGAVAVCENAVSFFNDLHDRPIMVVGAGPSLDDAKSSIKQYRSSLFVLAANAVFKPLRDAGIQPDAVICIEPRPEAKASFDGLGEEGIPLLFVPGTNPDVVRNWKGPKLVVSQQQEESLPHTGTVVGTALDVAIRLGGNPIILTGVDLALFGDWYAKGVEKTQSETAGKLLASKTSKENQQNAPTYKVVGIDGAMVQSTQAFRHFLHSLETLIEDAKRHHPYLKIYDLKTRGAKINGTQSLPPSSNSMATILGNRLIKKHSAPVGDFLSTGVRP